MPRVNVRFRGLRPEVDVQLGLGIRPRVERWQARFRPRKPSDELLEVREIARLRAIDDAPLLSPPPDPDSAALHVAMIVPDFYPESEHHTMLAHLTRGLERRGHTVSLWIDDVDGRSERRNPRAARRFRRAFGPFAAEVRWSTRGFDGADVAVATSWRGIYRLCSLAGIRARVYLAHDHEPDFYATSYQRQWAQDALTRDFHAITTGPWLADLMRDVYGHGASHFEPGIDRALFRPLSAVRRREDVLIFAGQESGALPVILAAIAEVKRRRPRTELWTFNERRDLPIDVPVLHLGVRPQAELAEIFSQATVGLNLSMTNVHPLAPRMAACGLPCVELETPATLAAFGRAGALELTAMDPVAIADAVIGLLDDPARREERLRQAAELVAARSWDAASDSFERGLRAALRSRAPA